MARDAWISPIPHTVYNSGVIVFKQNHELIQEWAALAPTQNGAYRSDQELLSALIAKKNYPIVELSPIYNWSRRLGDDPQIQIHHWHGSLGRSIIKYQMRQW